MSYRPFSLNYIRSNMFKKLTLAIVLLSSFNAIAASKAVAPADAQQTVKKAFIQANLMKDKDWSTKSDGTLHANNYVKPVTADYKLGKTAFSIALTQEPGEVYNYLLLNTASRCYQAATVYIPNGWGNAQQQPSGDAKLIVDELVKLQAAEDDMDAKLQLSNGTFSIHIDDNEASCEFTQN